MLTNEHVPPPAATVVVGSQVRPAEELFTALRKGSTLQKYGRRGVPKFHHFKLSSSDDKDLQWRSSNNKLRSIALLSVTRVIPGQQTSVFRRAPDPGLEPYSFSLIYNEGPRQERSLDLVCKNQQEFETWYYGIQLVITVLKANPHQTPVGLDSQSSSRRTSAADSESSVDHSLGSKSTTHASLVTSQSMVQRSLTTVLGSQSAREIGDCYMWGSPTQPMGKGGLDVEVVAGWPSSPLPRMVDNTQALDVVRVACGSRHGALVTRGLELYTWGNGECGNLGHGSCRHGEAPQQVTALFRKGVAVVSCGDTHSASLTHDGTLYTWGSGTCGQLGHGDTWTYCWPTRVAAFADVKIKHVSCGPFHSAAIDAMGQLFTWGDGMAGKLGHGDSHSSMFPKRVEALVGMQVLDVSCGWWHTAAVVAAQPDIHDNRNSNNHHTTPGQLYTWGADFSWLEVRGSSGKPTESWKIKRDNNQGCLGVGDTYGRMVPCRAKGSMDQYSVKQVVCGCNFTVAITTDGQAYQMGSMDASNGAEKDCPWEGARTPTLVQGSAFGLFIEEVAAGRQHVAVVASRMLANGDIPRDTRRMRLLTWGRGTEGQLGIGTSDHHAMPQIVTALERRRILHVACGGNHTLAVCAHDPSVAEAMPSRDSALFRSGRAPSSRPALTLAIPTPTITNQGPATTSRIEGRPRQNHGDISPSQLGPLSSGSKRHSSRLGAITTKLLTNSGKLQRQNSMSSSSSASGLSSRGAGVTDSAGTAAVAAAGSRSSRGPPTSQASQRALSMIGSSIAVELNLDGRPASFTANARTFASTPSSPRGLSLRRSTQDDEEAEAAVRDSANTLQRMAERILKLEAQLQNRNLEVEELRSILASRGARLHYAANGAQHHDSESDMSPSCASSPLQSPQDMPTPAANAGKKASFRTTTTTDNRTSTEFSTGSSGHSMPSPLANGMSTGTSPRLGRGTATTRSNELPPRAPGEQGLKGGQRPGMDGTAFTNQAAAAAAIGAAGGVHGGMDPSKILMEGGRSISFKMMNPEVTEEYRRLHPNHEPAASRDSSQDPPVSRDASISGVVNLRLQLSATSSNPSAFDQNQGQTLALRIAGAAASVENGGDDVTLLVPHSNNDGACGTPVLYNNMPALSRNGSQVTKASGEEIEDLRVENRQLREQLDILQRRITAMERLQALVTSPRGEAAATSTSLSQHWSLPASTSAVLNARHNGHRRAISMDTAATLQRFFSSQGSEHRQQSQPVMQQQQPQSSTCAPTGPGKAFTEEVEAGVFLTLEPAETGGYELKRIRFSKRAFAHDEAETWWSRNKTRIREHYNLVAPSATSGGGSPMLLSRGSGNETQQRSRSAGVASHRSTPSGDYTDLSRLLLSSNSHASASSSDMMELPIRHHSQPRGTIDSGESVPGGNGSSSHAAQQAAAVGVTTASHSSAPSPPRTGDAWPGATPVPAAAATPQPPERMSSHPLSLLSPQTSRTPSTSGMVVATRALSPVEDVSERDPESATASEAGSYHSIPSASPSSPHSDKLGSRKLQFTSSPLSEGRHR